MPDSHIRIARASSVAPIVGFAFLYLLAWTVLPALLGKSFALDVVESLSWGQEWQWGYYKHPPLAPIVLNLFYEAFGKFGPYLLSQLCIALTLWMVWLTGRRLMDPQRALLGTVLTMGVTYYNFPAIEFNHNIAQMPIWAALGYAFVAALQGKHWRHWVLLGVLAGLGLLTKYSIGVLLLAFGVYVLCSGQYRRCLLTPGPWLAVALMALLFAPHWSWLQASEWLPFAYASERSMAQGGNPRLQALEFPLTQLAAHLPLLLALGIAWWRTRRSAPAQTNTSSGDKRWHIEHPQLLLALSLLPAALVVVLGVLAGLRLRDMWGSPMWAFTGLLIVALVPDARLALMRPRLLRGVAMWLVLVTSFMVVYMSWGAELRKRPGRVDWPAISLAQQLEQAWHQYTQCKLDVVAGDYWLAGLVSAYSSDRPSVLIDGDPRFSPWVDTQRLREKGAVWLWRVTDDPSVVPLPPPTLAQASTDPQLQQFSGSWTLPWPYSSQAAPLRVNWRAYLPQSCALSGKG